jgi:hypothetical protein
MLLLFRVEKKMLNQGELMNAKKRHLIAQEVQSAARFIALVWLFTLVNADCL